MTLSDRRLTFLNDMVCYYGKDVRRRAVIRTNYSKQNVYKTFDGKCCPITRYMNDEVDAELLKGSLINLTYKDKPASICDFLPDHILVLGTNFLAYVMMLHDNDQFWNYRKGLTYSGQRAYSDIMNKFCCNEIDMDYDSYF